MLKGKLIPCSENVFAIKFTGLDCNILVGHMHHDLKSPQTHRSRVAHVPDTPHHGKPQVSSEKQIVSQDTLLLPELPRVSSSLHNLPVSSPTAGITDTIVLK